MVLELVIGILHRGSLEVSIPVRDLVVLEHTNPQSSFNAHKVSIPVRDLVVLEHLPTATPENLRTVSIPVRDLVVLERLCSRR